MNHSTWRKTIGYPRGRQCNFSRLTSNTIFRILMCNFNYTSVNYLTLSIHILYLLRFVFMFNFFMIQKVEISHARAMNEY